VLHQRLGSRHPAAALAPGVAEVSTTREVRLVQFVLSAPKASQVTVVGDFNEWDPAATPMVRREGGAWTAAIPVSPGRHVYAFIVDGDRWVADPAAPMAPEDGFGIRNSVIVVGGPEST
jgi:1,4-alpha-glucan branching enzyme